MPTRFKGLAPRARIMGTNTRNLIIRLSKVGFYWGTVEARLKERMYLLTLCQVQLKEFQMTDWRVRPLPAEMMHYAREDTHYLLYCYDLLRERLFVEI
ncbi:unnamed protein product, partial [Mesorhabditis belari]|uniref:3'-5' exonuclease domain-containing protein n=1 Tax=Mesorhabditis belari TaxID=2138241 RepID=A0AAF3F762_9BILA